MDSNFQYAGAVNLAAFPAPRPTPPLRNRKFARLSAGGDWIRTSRTRARSTWFCCPVCRVLLGTTPAWSPTRVRTWLTPWRKTDSNF